MKYFIAIVLVFATFIAIDETKESLNKLQKIRLKFYENIGDINGDAIFIV